MLNITLLHYMILSALLFSIGIFGVMSRRNAISILMSIELIFNAVNINMVAASKYFPQDEIYGQIFTIFIISVAAAESVLGLAIILALYKKRSLINADELNLLKW